METGGNFGWKVLVMVALLTAGMGGALNAEATDCALAKTDWEEYCCVEKVDEWSGTVKCTLTGVERKEMIRGDLDEEWTVGDPFIIKGKREEDKPEKDELYLYLDLGLKDGTEADEYTANVTFEAYYKDEEEPVCDGKIKVEVTVVEVDLNMEGCEDSEEMTIGGYVPVNANNDNGSEINDHIPTTRDFDTDNYTDNDLVKISLTRISLFAGACVDLTGFFADFGLKVGPTSVQVTSLYPRRRLFRQSQVQLMQQ